MVLSLNLAFCVKSWLVVCKGGLYPTFLFFFFLPPESRVLFQTFFQLVYGMVENETEREKKVSDQRAKVATVAFFQGTRLKIL